MVNLFSLIPLLISILVVTNISVIYLMAVCYGHVNPIYPYLSDSGTTHPEAGFFSMFLILEAILSGIFGWIRYKQIQYIFSEDWLSLDENSHQLSENQTNLILKLNELGLYSAIIRMLGIGGVAAFRSTEHPELHMVLGAGPAFSGTFLYYFIQIWISYKLMPSVNSKRMAHFRLGVALFAVLMNIIMSITSLISVIQLRIPVFQLLSEARLKWDESYGGYIAHCISAIAENLMLLMAVLFFASFFSEFKRIKSKDGNIIFLEQ